LWRDSQITKFLRSYIVQIFRGTNAYAARRRFERELLPFAFERDPAWTDRDFDVRIPLLLRRVLLAREVRVPVSLARPDLDALRFARAPLLRVAAEREELRPRLSLARAVVLLREERPSLRF
jgi:hypothetical protein